MKEKIVRWFKTNKEDIKTSVIVVLAAITVFVVMFNILLMSMCADLSKRVSDLEYSTNEMLNDLRYDSAIISEYVEREERCRNGEDIGDDEFSIICIQK